MRAPDRVHDDAGADARAARGNRPGLGSVVAAWGRRRLWRTAFAAATGGVRVTGDVPAGGCVVVANHASHADTAALLATLPAGSAPVVAAAADHWFATRWRAAVCRTLTGGHPVRRGGGGWDDLVGLAAHLREGRIIVVFPEGTRTRDGQLGAFRSGAFRLAEHAGVPVVPAAIVGTAEVLPLDGRGRVHRAACEVRFGEVVGTAGAEGADQARAQVTALLGQGPPAPGCGIRRVRRVPHCG